MGEKESKGYVGIETLVLKLEEIMGYSFTKIEEIVKNANVTITRAEIEKYLDELFEKEDADLKKRIQNTNIDEEIEDFTTQLEDFINASKYEFEASKLDYFKKYILILKDKCSNLLDLILILSNNDASKIGEELRDLDITLDDKGNILYEDVLRLVKPTAYNINRLLKMLEKANNPASYLNQKLEKIRMEKEGIFENDLYPSSLLQIKKLDVVDPYNIDEFIPLTETQEAELRRESGSKQKRMIRSLQNIFNNTNVSNK